jgi:NAD(P)-dependent dehydrogenase (short-subunit alcohol dehydrogenase family)
MQLDMNGRVALVTGAGRGLGRAHALMLASRGARIVVNDLAPRDSGDDPCREVVDAIVASGGLATSSYGSVVEDADQLVAAAISEYGALDIIVNNAGIMGSGLFGAIDMNDWWRVFDVHLRGTVNVTRAGWDHLAASGAGRIVNTASPGMLGSATLSAYGAAKAAIWGLTRSLAHEGRPLGINVNVILPAAATEMSKTIEDPNITEVFNNFLAPDHVSALVTWLVHQDTDVTDETFEVSGGRASRLTLASSPPVTCDGGSSPEGWRTSGPELVADHHDLTPMVSTQQMFVGQLAAADPSITERLADYALAWDQ